MGNAPSKAARKLPREKPTWAGGRVSPQATAEQRPERQPAFETKHKAECDDPGHAEHNRIRTALERDAKDPHLMAHLSQLGQVRVDHPTHPVQAARDAQRMYRARVRAEAQASDPQSSSATNRLRASSLTELLEARKASASEVALASLAARFRVDVATLHRLGRVVNTPGVDEGTVVRRTDKYGETSLTRMARWVDPVFSRG